MDELRKVEPRESALDRWLGVFVWGLGVVLVVLGGQHVTDGDASGWLVGGLGLTCIAVGIMAVQEGADDAKR